MITDVQVIISATEAAGQAGSWFPLICVTGKEHDTFYSECPNLEEVAAIATTESEAYKVAELLFMQNNRPDKIAYMECKGTDIANELAPYMSKSWRQLIVVGEYDDSVATFIETTEKQYFTHFASVAELTAAKLTDKDRTVAVVYSHDDVTNPEAAIVGRMAGYAAGEATYHAKAVKGVTADVFTESELEAIHKAGGFAYVEKNGRVATSNGITGSGEWIDVVESFDYLVQNIRYDVQEVFLNNPKVPYTDAGISMIESAVYNRLKAAYGQGMIATKDDGTAAFGTSFKKRSETTATDRVTRNYPYGTFEFELAGAIHKAKITGTVTA